MAKSLGKALLFGGLIFCASNSLADEGVSKGELLYETYCDQCHDSQVHMRAKRKAKNMDDIRHFVMRWQKHLELQWTELDIEQVTRYVNDKYYKYEK